jgi:hypothetical protein
MRSNNFKIVKASNGRLALQDEQLRELAPLIGLQILELGLEYKDLREGDRAVIEVTVYRDVPSIDTIEVK